MQTKLSTGLVYPFSAIVGQDEMKLALILNVIDPSIGGVLMMGHRGTGKSTAVRALADLLPDPWIVRGCKYNCDPNDQGQLCADCARQLAEKEKLPRERAALPVVDLPLGATEDRVCGSIDLERALKDGVKAFQPGLLARANRGFLYIDEVNLLEDHLVDLLLDVAVTGRNKVERENISIEHAARFVLIGSGNPEEGELRPQLLDRFGLYVEVQTQNEIDQRIEIIEKREAFERDAQKFHATISSKQAELRRRIERARKSFPEMRVERRLLRQIASLCSALKVDGHRGELTIVRSARALAAFSGRAVVAEQDVRQVATMALRHRLHRDPLAETDGTLRIEQTLDKVFQTQNRVPGSDGQGPNSSGNQTHSRERGRSAAASSRRSRNPEGQNGSDGEGEIPAPAAMDASLPGLSGAGHSRAILPTNSGSGGRHDGLRGSYNYQRGRYTRAVSHKRPGGKIAMDATMRMTVQHGGDFVADDLRYKQFAKKVGTLFIFAIDASGSMALNRISQAKGALLRLLKQSYVNRDSVAIIGFRGTEAEVLLPPSRSIVRARRILDTLKIGGGTPLSAGLSCSLKLAQRASAQTNGEIVLLLFTDGQANVPRRSELNADRVRRRQIIDEELACLGEELRRARISTVVVETANGFVSSGAARALAQKLKAEHLELSTRHAMQKLAGLATRRSFAQAESI